jgi:hypothetical protein
MGQELAMDELRIILLLTLRSFDFELVGAKPYSNRTAVFTDLDEVVGDFAFQEYSMEAKPRLGMPMRVTPRGKQ